MKILTNIKNNPKKSIFGFIVVGFGGRWLHTKFTDYQFRLQKCREVFHRGKQPMNHLHPPKRIVLVLNPAAKHGKAGKLFKKNASPLLQLSGCEVKVFQLEYEGEGKSLMEELDLDGTDMVVAAGGDGTVNEVVTGLLRRKDHSRWVNIPLGIIPLGALNTVCQRLSSPNSFNSQAKWIISCTNHILDSNTRYVDALEVKSDVGKQTFALTDFAWGSYRDAFHKEPKYWYFGPIKRHMAYFISALKSKIQTPKQFQLAYNEPTLIHDKVETTPIIPMGQNVDFGNIIWKVFGSLLPSWFVSGGAEQEGNRRRHGGR
uniref:acylglycerol kinase, mitochondrial-like n=1 Tax=Ciona intestinalis TaxID=7719 RepID=UPI000180B4C7|nr:acylglycerol kinase, mitochondrial-like [Ciona intestinalis]|eukprot:XP_002129387.1 acylglycerol kinase, mitochondrial-like [Ciona intestinalis]